MAYNFKSIADVEVVAEPIESANVLIEENGVIKKAPKTAVGGGGSGAWDAVIDVVEGSSGFFTSMELVSGDYQDLKEKILAGIFPNVLIRYVDGSYATGLSKAASLHYFSEDDRIHCQFSCNYNQRDVNLYSDGRIEN